MPHRWLSRKVRHPPIGPDQGEHRQPQDQPRNNVAEKRALDEFDFGQVQPPVTYQEQRPKTSGGIASRWKIKPQLDQHLQRPRTSDSHVRLPTGAEASAAPEDDEMIGIAFGSPTHPPTTFYGNLDDLMPAPLEKPELKSNGGRRDDLNRQRSEHWKKLGFLFKSRSASVGAKTEPREPFYKLNVQNGTRSPFLSRSTSVLSSLGHRHSASTPESQYSAPSNLELQVDGPTAIGVYPTRTSSREAAHRAPLPKLEINIPNVHMDRYSVMFGHLRTMSNPASNLLARRERSLEKLNVVDVIPEEEYAGPPTRDTSTLTFQAPSRRATSPSLAKPTGGFSLFPNASPASNDAIKRGLKSPRTHLQRARTSPARISPARDYFDAEKPEPLRFRRMASENNLVSPDLTTASTEQAPPWSGGGVYQTPISAVTPLDHEIIFDITLFDHSRVSSAVQTEAPKLAPNVDSINELIKAEHLSLRSAVSMMSTGETIYEGRIGKDQFAAIDDAIAAMEDVASPVLPADSFPIAQLQVQDTGTTEPDMEPEGQPRRELEFQFPAVPVPNTNPELNAIATSEVPLDQPAVPGGTFLPIPRMRSKAHVGLLSPVVEASSERALSIDHIFPMPSARRKTPTPPPIQAHTTSPARPASTQKTFFFCGEDDAHEQDPAPDGHIENSSPQQGSPKRDSLEHDRPNNDAPEPDNLDQDSPPPVPEKDTKYIPLSRFALKNTASIVTKRTGIRPHQPQPSLTELPPLPIPLPTPPPIPPPTYKPAARPPQIAQVPALSKSQSKSPSSTRNHSKAQPINHTPTSRFSRHRPHKASGQSPSPTTARRVAEVAVARTVSLKRKPGVAAIPTTVVVTTPRREDALVPNLLVTADTKPDLRHGDTYKAEDGETLVKLQHNLSPTIVAAKKGHRPGVSVGGVIEDVA